MDDLHNETLMIPQVHVVVDFNDEFVNMSNPLGDPNFYYLAFASTSFGYISSPNITINGNLSIPIIIDEPLWLTMAKQKYLWKPKNHNATKLAFHATNHVLIII